MQLRVSLLRSLTVMLVSTIIHQHEVKETSLVAGEGSVHAGSALG
jgi:hypothetical protein